MRDAFGDGGDHLAGPVYVSLNHVTAEAFSDRKRPLKIDSATGLQTSEGRSREGFERSIGAELTIAHFDDGEVHTVDRNRIADACALQNEVRFDHQKGAVRSPINSADPTRLHDQSGED